MSTAFRSKVERSLVEEIALISGGRFEQFGYAVMTAIHPAEWIHRGTTIEGAPRGYTVDTSAAGATLVAEMSSEAGYFQNEKPKKDLEHVIALHPKAEHIWLLASREATPGELTACANLITGFRTAHPSIATVDILDARKIAEYIFDNLASQGFVDSISAYLPSVGRLADENAFSHHLPKYSGYLARTQLEDEVIDNLRTAACAVVSGISGIGKSALVVHVSERLRTEFDLVIWIDARELSRVDELSDIDVRRSGVRHNIAALLRRHKCLLILDDTLLSPNKLREMDTGQSKLIVTCQVTADAEAILVGDLDRSLASKLLQAGVAPQCPPELLDRVFENVGGYPLLLVALNTLARDEAEGWGAVAACCEEAVSAVEDERHDKVCKRVLLQHKAAVERELEFIKWCGVSRFDADLASICVSSRAIPNMQKRAFLSAAPSGDVRVHDVVYKSILSTIDIAAAHAVEFRDKLDDFIRLECEHERMVIHRLARSHVALFERLLEADARPSFLYAVALARSTSTPISLLGNPVAAAHRVAALPSWQGREVEVRAIIEVIEAIFTLSSETEDKETAKTRLETQIEALTILSLSSAAFGKLRRDLPHHHAKMLERLDRLDEAEAEFRSVLAEYPEFAAARLQLARILGKTKRPVEALVECKRILDAANEVSAQIVLESLRLLASMGTPAEVKMYEHVFTATLRRARETDKAIAFRLIASVAQKLWFVFPEFVLQLFDEIEWRDMAPSSDSERFDLAQSHKQAAKAAHLDDPRRGEFLATACEAYEAIANPSDFQRGQIAEGLILFGRFEAADRHLEATKQAGRKDHWWHRKAQVQLELGAYDDALKAIDTALAELSDGKYKAAFLEVRYKIRAAQKDSLAVEDLRAAIDSLPPEDKFRLKLEAQFASREKAGR